MTKDAKRKAAKKQATLWLNMGWHQYKIIDELWNLHGLNPDEVTLLLQEVRHEQTAALADINRPEFLAQQMTRLEALAVKAQEEGNLAVALGAYKELNQLAKLHAS